MSEYRLVTFAEIPNTKTAERVAYDVAALFIQNPAFTEAELGLVVENSALADAPSTGGFEVKTQPDAPEAIARLYDPEPKALILINKGETLVVAPKEKSFVVFSVEKQEVSQTNAPEFDILPKCNGCLVGAYLMKRAPEKERGNSTKITLECADIMSSLVHILRSNLSAEIIHTVVKEPVVKKRKVHKPAPPGDTPALPTAPVAE